MKNVSRLFHSIALTALLCVLVLSYQNCTKSTVGFQYSGLKNSGSAATDNGNGGTYDGKPSPGLYIRRSGSSCSTQNNLIGKLEVDATDASVSEDLCVAMDYSLEFGDSRLEHSFYNSDFIGLNAAIFERSEATVPSNSGAVVDLWCRYVDSSFGLDVVLKTNNSSSEATVYVGENLSSSQPSARKLNPIAASKSSSATLLVAASSDGRMRTEVDVSGPAKIKYPGRTTMNLDGKDLDLPVTCRVENNSPALYEHPINVVAMLQMDQPLGPVSAGATINDSSRYNGSYVLSNNNGSGANFISGFFGNALSFDGVDDHVDLYPLATNGPAGFSFSSWVLASNSIPDQSVIFGVFDSSLFDNTLRVGVGLCGDAGNRAIDQGKLSLDSGSTCNDTGIDVRDGQWHMVTVSVSSGSAVLYLDGVFVSQLTVDGIIKANDIWDLGQDWDSATNQNDRFQGALDEVVVWNRALTAAEVKDAFDSAQ